jgi:hypothetical protein
MENSIAVQQAKEELRALVARLKNEKQTRETIKLTSVAYQKLWDAQMGMTH